MIEKYIAMNMRRNGGIEMNKQGIKVKFNKHNKWGTVPCCCEKGYFTKFGVSTVFCFICGIRKISQIRNDIFVLERW